MNNQEKIVECASSILRSEGNTTERRMQTKAQAPKQRTFKYWSVTDFCDTKHNWNEEYMEYYAGQQEKCPTTGKLHWQVVIATKKKVNFN